MMSRWHGFFRESAGPGWVLLGDAGHFKDPTPGQGIADALRQSVKLAAAIQATADDPRAADRILGDWWSWRDEDAWEMYWYANDMGVAGTTPLVIGEIQRRIAASPQLTHALLSVLNHDLAPSQAFSTGLGLAAISTALRTNPGQRKCGAPRSSRSRGHRHAATSREAAAAVAAAPTRAQGQSRCVDQAEPARVKRRRAWRRSLSACQNSISSAASS